MKMVFDVETNGLSKEQSVLSFSAVVVDKELNVINEIDRYYYPVEPYNMTAVKVNGLTEETIRNNRAGVSYPKHFCEDKEIAELFTNKDIEMIIAHNIPFDRGFIEHHLGISIDDIEQCCTMRSTQYLYNAPYIHRKTGEPKYPKLSEAVEWAGIDTAKIIEKTGKGYHDSLFDVYCTLALYKHLQKNIFVDISFLGNMLINEK